MVGVVLHVAGYTIQDVAHRHRHTVASEIAVDDLGVVGGSENGFVQSPADLAGIDVDGGDDLDVARLIAAQDRMGQPDSCLVAVGSELLTVIADPLDQ